MQLKKALLFSLVLLVALPALAQRGCVESPENPTAVLALLGGAAACVASVRQRVAARPKGR